jgi:hypothetical protein
MLADRVEQELWPCDKCVHLLFVKYLGACINEVCHRVKDNEKFTYCIKEKNNCE